MLYIEDKTQDMQLKLIRKLASEEKFEVIFWLYQGYEDSEFLDIPVSHSLEGESVTIYDDDGFPCNTARIELNSSVYEVMTKNQELLRLHCDSITLYKPKTHEWYMSTIGHEGMSLIRDKSTQTMLSSSGFNVSTEAPSWW